MYRWVFSIVMIVFLWGHVEALPYAWVGKPYYESLQNKDYVTALSILERMIEDSLTVPEKKLKLYLSVFRSVDAMVQEEIDPLVLTAADISLEVQKQVNRLYRLAKDHILDNEPEVAKTLLIHVLYLYSGHFQAGALLDRVLAMPVGSYKIQNMVTLYFKRSKKYFFGGNYLLASRDLEVLVLMDRKNQLVYEKLGSSYYMMNENKKALDNWSIALYLNPANVKLKTIVEETKTRLIEEAKQKQTKTAVG